MTEPATLATEVTDFAAGRTLTVIPAVPERDLGPEVRLSPATVDLPGFLELAASLGGGVLYLDATPFDPEDDEIEDPPDDLVDRRGQVGEVTVAFSANGLTHFWQHRADWYQQWQELAATPMVRQFLGTSRDTDEHPSEEERARLTGELTAGLLADPAFRAAKPGGARQRYAKSTIPADTHRWILWHATREACDQADELTRLQYEQITGQLDELAAELLSSAEYRQASSPAARKQVAERFLTLYAAGFAPPSHVRDELYARAQRQAKAVRQPATLI